MTGKEVANFRAIKALGIPYSRTHLFRLVKSGDFPRPFKVGSHRNSPPVWWLHEVIQWLEAKAKAGRSE
jgi:predicted DNA-binding transcriptional regulator AlpA